MARSSLGRNRRERERERDAHTFATDFGAKDQSSAVVRPYVPASLFGPTSSSSSPFLLLLPSTFATLNHLRADLLSSGSGD